MSSAQVDDAAAQSSLVRTAKDLFAGAAGGIAQVLLGKWQSFSRFIGSLRVLGCLSLHLSFNMEALLGQPMSICLFGIQTVSTFHDVIVQAMLHPP